MHGIYIIKNRVFRSEDPVFFICPPCQYALQTAYNTGAVHNAIDKPFLISDYFGIA